jgi:glucuronokinase
LLGNPSDGFGGKTIGLAIAGMSARVELDATQPALGDDGAGALIEATVARFNRFAGESVPPRARLRTDIPREVGLGGSSAIVIATLRALCARCRVRLEPEALAGLALAIETEDLGIAAGPQDRFIQAHGTLLFMDFSAGARCERLDPALLPRLFLAYARDAAEPSSAVHSDLRTRFEAGDARTRVTLGRIAELADRGHAALLERRPAELGELMAQNFRLRAELVELEPRHMRMVELARELGAPANYAGSGGAIIGIVPADRALGDLREAFAAEGYDLVEATPAG